MCAEQFEHHCEAWEFDLLQGVDFVSENIMCLKGGPKTYKSLLSNFKTSNGNNLSFQKILRKVSSFIHH